MMMKEKEGKPEEGKKNEREAERDNQSGMNQGGSTIRQNTA
jgi:hypothetical protein